MENYFNSKAHMYKFALNELDGKSRMKLLGINMSLFANTEKAKQWHNDVMIELEQCGLNDVKTVEKLQQIYHDMI